VLLLGFRVWWTTRTRTQPRPAARPLKPVKM